MEDLGQTSRRLDSTGRPENPFPLFEQLSYKPVDAVFAPGMGPVSPQLRSRGGAPIGERQVAADFWRLRAIPIAIAELVGLGCIDPRGAIVLSGRATANAGDVARALEGRIADNNVILEAQHAVISSDSAVPNRIAPHAFVGTYSFYRDFPRAYGRPATAGEAKRVTEATEAGLMAGLVRRTVPKVPREQRYPLSQDILEDPYAKNTIDNVVQYINLMDKRAGKVWEGTTAIVSPNFGQMQRIIELFEAFGISKGTLVPLGAEQVLRTAGYGQEELSGYFKAFDAENSMPNTIRTQERWLRAVREEPRYILELVSRFENDDRLTRVMTGLEQWYGKDVLHAADPSLSTWRDQTPSVLRATLSNIKRVLPGEEFGQQADLGKWAQQNSYLDSLTDRWVHTVSQKVS